MPVISKLILYKGSRMAYYNNYSLLDEISDANDIDGDVIVYNISKVLSGELTVNGVKVDGINLNKGQEAVGNPV